MGPQAIAVGGLDAVLGPLREPAGEFVRLGPQSGRHRFERRPRVGLVVEHGDRCTRGTDASAVVANPPVRTPAPAGTITSAGATS